MGRRARWAGTLAVIACACGAGPAWAGPGDLDRSYGLGSGASRIDFGSLPGATRTNDLGSGVAVQPDGRIVVAGYSDARGTTDFAVARVLAEQGTLDASFAGGPGRATVDFGMNWSEFGYGIALQPDGRIVVAGTILTAGPGGTYDFGVARLVPEGFLDTSYGLGTGGSRMDFGGLQGASGSSDFGRAVALQPNGRIVVAGQSNAFGSPDFAVARVLSPEGTFDASFGGTGAVARIESGQAESGEAVALQPDGKIVIAGDSGEFNRDFLVARMVPEGFRDSGYGLGTGASRIDFGGDDLARAVAVQPDGRIVVAGMSFAAGGTSSFAVARVLSPQGTFDTSFGAGTGRALVNLGVSARARAMAVQPDGKILLAGTVDQDIGVARLQPNGTLDTTFGNGGKTRIDLGATESAASIALRRDGKIVLGGTITSGGNSDMLVVRLEGDPGGASGGSKGPAGSGGTPPRCAGKRATVVGTKGKDRLKGTRRADVIAGLGGRDRITGLGGNDRICGGSGNDRLDGGNGNDRVEGGAGKDNLRGGKGKDRIKGGAGNDRLDGGAAADVLEGQGGRDTLLGRGGRDRLKGGAGKDKQQQ